DIAAVEASLPDEETHAVNTSELALVLTQSEARQVVERWLAEARVSRDTARFVLPPSLLHLGVGDVIALPDNAALAIPTEPETDTEPVPRYRLDRMELGTAQSVDAVRIDPEVYLPTDIPETLPIGQEFEPPLPVLPLFMDLPLLTGEETPHAPHLAVTAAPWPGTVAVYSSGSDSDYALEQIIAARSTIGVTQTDLAAAAPGRWDLGADLQVKLISGALQSRAALAVLNGANAVAIGDGSNGNWEIFQFREAELVGDNTYMLRGRLRGQLGSDGLMPLLWPEGSYVVLLDGSFSQLELSLAQRRMARHYRIGPARRGYDDPSYIHQVEAFDGNGLRPYAPVHLRLSGGLGSDISVRWIRRSRVEGDSWDLAEIPLGEAREAYRIRILRGTTLLREQEVSAPVWTYSLSDQSTDAALSGDIIEVAQLSDRYGAGFAARMPIA
ncbi:phage tail protein, partial [Pseudophaeobacter sp.]|uniref:phage tail protein n=1 Tax=Pseudophaeobacter sp. TaxID=1971739 RepID=UPI0026189E36